MRSLEAMASPEMSNFEEILVSFKKRLSAEHVELFQLATFDDLKDAITRIQKEQAARKSLRNLNKIKPFMNGLSQYAQVIEVFVQAKPEILAFIWVSHCESCLRLIMIDKQEQGPIKLCLQVGNFGSNKVSCAELNPSLAYLEA